MEPVTFYFRMKLKLQGSRLLGNRNLIQIGLAIEESKRFDIRTW